MLCFAQQSPKSNKTKEKNKMEKALEILWKGNYEIHGGKEIHKAAEYLESIEHECIDNGMEFYEIWNDENTEYIGFGIEDDVYYFSNDIKEMFT